jgi:dephospho-CoA kinase
LKLHVIDADQIGHEQLAVESIRDQIVAVFGRRVLESDGSISRSLLAVEVFGESPQQQDKRNQLNEIVHPAIRADIRSKILNVPQDADAIVLDAALLLEAGWADECDAIIFIDTPLEIRQQRVIETRGWSIEDHRRREESQWSLDRKRAYCQFVVDNSGTPEASAIQMEQALRSILARSKSLHS